MNHHKSNNDAFNFKIKYNVLDFHLDAEACLPGQGITAITGPSGCGKTSLLRCIAGLNRPRDGHILINGRCWYSQANRVFVPVQKRSIGFVFQHNHLFPHRNVAKNITFGKRKKQVNWSLYHDLLFLLNLSHLENRDVTSLSGGERKRVAIGRALLMEPELLILDEPFNGLDTKRREEIIGFMKIIMVRWKIPVFFVSHHEEEVKSLANWSVRMAKGKIEEIKYQNEHIIFAHFGREKSDNYPSAKQSLKQGLKLVGIKSSRPTSRKTR